MRRELKRFERGADKCREILEGTLLLCGAEVYLNDSEVLYEVNEFTQEIFERDFDIKSGSRKWRGGGGETIANNVCFFDHKEQ